MSRDGRSRDFRVADALLEELDPERFLKGISYLAGLSMYLAVAILERRSQPDLQLFTRSTWAFWLSVAPEACRFPLQRLALRSEVGPPNEEPPPTRDPDLLAARDHVDRALFDAAESRHQQEVNTRLSRLRGARSH